MQLIFTHRHAFPRMVQCQQQHMSRDIVSDTSYAVAQHPSVSRCHWIRLAKREAQHLTENATSFWVMCELSLHAIESSACLSPFRLFLSCSVVTVGARTHFKLVWAMHLLPSNTGQFLGVLEWFNNGRLNSNNNNLVPFAIHTLDEHEGVGQYYLEVKKMSMLNNELQFSLFPDGETSFIPGSSSEQLCAFRIFPLLDWCECICQF